MNVHLLITSRSTDVCTVLAFRSPLRLYDSCSWDERLVKKTIVDGKLAPMFPGSEDEADVNYDSILCKTRAREECPICFLVSVSETQHLFRMKN